LSGLTYADFAQCTQRESSPGKFFCVALSFLKGCATMIVTAQATLTPDPSPIPIYRDGRGVGDEG